MASVTDQNLSKPARLNRVLLTRIGSMFSKRTPKRKRNFLMTSGVVVIAIAFTATFLFVTRVTAVVRTWDGGGADNNWSTCANWSANVCPSASDIATFDGTSTKDAVVDASFTGTVSSVSITSGYTGTISQSRSLTATSGFTQAGGTFTAGSQTLSVGAFNLSAGSFTASSATTTITQGVSITGSPTFNANAGTVAFTGSGSVSYACANKTFNLITISRTGAMTIGSDCTFPLGTNPTITTSNSVFTLNGTLSGTGTLTTTGINTIAITSTGGITGFTGLNAPSLTISSNANFSAMTTFSMSGSLTVSAGTTTLPAPTGTGIVIVNLSVASGATLTASPGAMSLQGSITLASGSTFNANGGSITLTTNNAATYDCNNATFNLITISKSSGATINSNCSFPLGNNPTVTLGGSNLTLNGSITGTGTLTISTVNNLVVGSTGVISGFSGLNNAGGITTSASLNFGGFTTFSMNGTLTVSAGTTTFPAPTGTGIVIQTLTVASGATFTASPGAMSIQASVTLSSGSTFNANGGSIAMSGTGAATYDCNNATFNSVTLNRSSAFTVNSNCTFPLGNNPTVTSGGSNVTLNGTFTGTGTMAMSSINALIVGSTGVLSGFSGLTTTGGITASASLNFSSFTTFSMSGALTVSAGTTTFPAPTGTGIVITSLSVASGATFTASPAAMSIQGAITLSSGSTFNANGGSITMTGNSAVVYDCNNATFNSVTLSRSSAFTVNSNCTFPLGNNPTITSGGSNVTLNGTFTGTGTMTMSSLNALIVGSTGILSGFSGANIAGGITASASLNFGSFTTFSMSGALTVNAGTTTFPAPTGTGIVLTTLSVASGATFTASPAAMSIQGSITLSSGSTFNANGGSITMTGNSSVVYDCNNATFNSVTLSRSSAFTVNSNCTFPLGNNPTITSGNTTVTLNGTLVGTGTITAASGAVGGMQFNSTAVLSGFTGANITGINVAGATMDFTSYSPFAVSGALTVSSGVLSFPATMTGSVSNTALSGGTFNASSGNMAMTGSLTVTGSPTFNANGGTITLSGTSPTYSCGNITFNRIVISNSGTSTINSNCTFPLGANPTIANTVNLSGTLTGTGTLTSTTGTLTLSAGAVLTGFTSYSGQSMTINGATADFSTYSAITLTNTFNVSSGTFTAPPTLTVGFLFNHTGGTFNHNNGTVVMNGSSIAGTTTFYNFTKIVAVNSNLNFARTVTQTFLGTLTLNGGSTSARLTIASDANGNQFKIDPQGPRNIQFVNIKDANNLNGSAIQMAGSGSVDGGNNLNFNFTNVAPNAPASLGPTDAVTGVAISSNQPTLNFTMADVNPQDTEKYQIQISTASDFSTTVVDYTSALAPQGVQSFTVGQAAGSGTYTTGSSGQHLAATNYYWRVKATDNSVASSGYTTANGGSMAFVVDTSTPLTTLLGPTNLVNGSSTSTNQPTLTFNITAGVSDTVQYQIQISTVSNFASTVVDYTSDLSAQGALSFTVGQAAGSGSYAVGTESQTLSLGSYYWRVRGTNNNSVTGTYTTANSGAVAFVEALAPDAPTGLSGTPGSQQMALTWSVPANNGSAISDYQVEFKLHSDGSWNVYADGVSTTASATVTGLTNGSSYDFRVSAVSAIGTGSASSTYTNTPFGVPVAPTIGTATPGNAQASVTFTANGDGGSTITSFTITSSPGNVTASGASSPITVTGLTNGTAYTFTAKANNVAGASTASSASNSVTPFTVPSTPTSLVATSGNQQISLAWTAPSANGSAITDYVVEYKVTTDPSFTTFADGTSATTGATVTGLTDGVNYTFRVSATNSAGTGSVSSTANATTFTTPGTPTSLSATPGNTQAVLSWSAPSNGGTAITDYVVEYKLTSDSIFTTFSDGVSGSTGATVTGLTNGSSYTFRVSATNLKGTGSVSSTTTATPRTVPDAPTVGFAVAGDSQASVTFSGNGNGGSAITSYTVTSSPGNFTGTGSTSPIVVSGLTNGTAYTFTVKANNAAGASSASSATNSISPSGLPGVPQNLTATYGDHQVTLNWDPPANDGGTSIFDYLIEYEVTFSFPFHVYAHAVSSATSIVVTGLTNGQAYEFQVSSINSIGAGTPSNLVVATPKTVPDAPTALNGTPGNNQVSLTWTAPAVSGGSNITDYTVEYKLASSGSWSTFAHTASTTAARVVTGLTNGSSYNFRVSAVNVVGAGAVSSTFTTTPSSFPSAPTITSVTRGNGQVSIAFTAGADGGQTVTGFTATSTPGGFTATSATSPIVVTGLTNGTSYTFTVHATNATGNSPESATSSSATPATVPDAPTSLVATYGDTTVALSWHSPASQGGSSVTDYQVEYKLSSSGSWSVFADGTSTGAGATVTGLTNGSSYDFRVKAINAIGAGATSAVATTTPHGFPGAPTGLLTTYGNGQIFLTWTAPVSDGGSAITDYRVEYKSVNTSSWSSFNDGVSTATSATVNGLLNGAGYNFRVSTANTFGIGVASSIATETPKTLPSAPTIGTATKANATAIVTFTAPSSTGGSAITSYTVTSTPGNITATGSSSPITVTGLTNGTAYTFKVKATNGVGVGAESAATNSVTPNAVPDAPTGLTVSRGGTGQVQVNFTPGADNGSSIISYTAVSNPDGITATGIFSNVTVSGLTNGRTYTFTVYATNANGNSLSSVASSSITPATIPGSPTSVSAVRGNTQATVSFGAPSSSGGTPVTLYTVTSSPGAITATGTSSPITVTGLTNETAYTFTVKATNVIGTGPNSSQSAAVTPTSVANAPDAPSNLQSSYGNTLVSLYWSPRGNGGAAITDYIVEYKLATDSSWSVFSDGVTTSPNATVTGLTNDLAYHFRVSAVNSAGTSPVSNTTGATPSIGPATANQIMPGSSDSGYYLKVLQKPDGNTLMAYYDSSALKEIFIGCTDINCNGRTQSDSGINPVGYWGLLYFKSDDLPSYISKDISITGTLSRLDCADQNCTSSSFTSSLFPSTGGTYGPVAGAVRPNGKPFIAMDGVAGMGGILDSYSCADEGCTSGTRRTLDTDGAGINPAVAVMPDNRPVISYYDNVNHSLKLYVCANADCTSGTARTLHAGTESQPVGETSAVVIREDGTAGIAYVTNSGMRFYDCPNADCSGGSVATNSYSVNDESSATLISLSNAGGSVIQLDSDGNPIIMSAGARRRGVGNLSIYNCYDPKCSEGRFRTLVDNSSNIGGFPSFYIRNDGGYVIGYHSYSGKRAYLYNYLPTSSSSLVGLDSNLSVAQVSRQDPTNVQTSPYSDPTTQNFSTAVVDLRLQTSSGIPLSDVTVTFINNGNMTWANVSGASDLVAGKAVIENMGSASGADSTHSLYVPKRAQDNAVRICPDATNLNMLTESCSNGYVLTADGNQATIVTIDGQAYWKITGLTGTGGLGVPLVNGSIGLTLTPNNMSVGSGVDVIAHWTPTGELASTNTAAVDFPSGFTLANTCSSTTVDADGDTTLDGSATITTDGSGNPRYLYTFSAATTTAGTSGLDFCIHVTAPGAASNYRVDAYDALGGYGSAFMYVGNENQVQITAQVDNVLTFSIRNTADTADLGNVGGLTFGPNLCNLGNLTDAGVQTCGYRLKVSTNAVNGYSVTIRTDGSLRNASNTAFLPNITAGNLVTSGTANYGISLDAGQATGGIGAITEGLDFNTDDSPTATGVTTGVNSTLYSSTNLNNPTSPDLTNTALVTHRAEADSSVPAGSYSQLVTYTVSASF